MSERIPVFVFAHDPVSQAGVAAQLRARPEIRVTDDGDVDGAAVALVVAESVDEATLRVVRAIQRNGCPRIVLVVTALDDHGLMSAVGAGTSAILRRNEATPERLTAAVVSANNGNGSIAPDLLGRLLTQVGQLQRHVLAPRGLTLTGLSEREIDVLRLVSEGLDTNEIADRLCYSERTIKNIIHDVTTRFQLRNRSHAVAYAMRQGLI